MDTSTSLYRYTPDGQMQPITDTSARLLVADSFLVNNGMARAPELHARRFTASCQSLANIDAGLLTRFWPLAMRHIPAKGQWFPRLELVGSRKQSFLQIRIRPAPERQNTARLIHCDTRDNRRHPRHKGPDILQLTAQRKNISKKGADEGILCTPSRYLLEGFFSSILWWEKNTLCQTPLSKRILPSITSALIMQIAASHGIATATRFRHLHELNGCETWVVNALHGIRRAINWPLAPWQVSTHTDHVDWQQALDQYALRPIHQLPIT
ncbi:MAG: aminotransferase class IV [Betaproteobacteria bacterium]|nr:aminotransferase class IV [Betaproteobacteria bacterium]